MVFLYRGPRVRSYRRVPWDLSFFILYGQYTDQSLDTQVDLSVDILGEQKQCGSARVRAQSSGRPYWMVWGMGGGRGYFLRMYRQFDWLWCSHPRSISGNGDSELHYSPTAEFQQICLLQRPEGSHDRFEGRVCRRGRAGCSGCFGDFCVKLGQQISQGCKVVAGKLSQPQYLLQVSSGSPPSDLYHEHDWRI